MKAALFGERALLVEVDSMEEVHRLRSALARAALPGVEEVVAGAASVLVVADPTVCDLDRLAADLPGWDLPGWDLPASAPGGSRLVTVPVRYDGPDLDDVARLCGIPVEEVVRRHQAPTYTVAFMGFSPGFAYLAGGDPGLRVPRLDTPRTRVPPGSVAVAGDMSAVYPQPTPGGWRLMGRTPLVMFDPHRRPPSVLSPGDRVRFTEDPSAADSPEPHRGPPAAAGDRWVEVVRPGPLTTVQDAGRFGFAHLGVPRAGAVDAASLYDANDAVGNPPGAAALEATVSGPRLRFGCPAAAAVVGAVASLDGTPLTPGSAVAVPAGATLSVGPTAPGLRCYVAVGGGFAVEPVLGSRSTDTLSGLGPPVLRAGDILPLGPAGPSAPGAARRGRGEATAAPLLARVLPGPHRGLFAGDVVARLCAGDYRVSTASDRTGVRCEGEPLGIDGIAELPSLGMVAGAVQVPPDGRPIVLLANHAPTGGYPVAAVVVAADLRLVAQARPGTPIRFVVSGTASAQS